MKPSEQSVLRNGVRQSSTWPAGATWAMILAAIFLSSQAIRAGTYNWTATSPDYYTNAAAWDLMSVPSTTNDTADIGNAGTVLFDSTMTNVLGSLLVGDGYNSCAFAMSGGELSITNTGATGFLLGYGAYSSGTFTMSGGTLTVARPSSKSRYYQDSFEPGYEAGSVGTFTLNDGTVNILCGMEAGIHGDGTVTVNGGTLIANGWFTFGRGKSSTQTDGSGTFNLNNGTVYVLKNGSTGVAGMRLRQQAPSGTANISGGTLYCAQIALGMGTGAIDGSTATLNISGGDIYLGDGGITGTTNNSLSNIVNISGGTFHTVNLGPNTTGQDGLSSVLPGGTNWTWEADGLPTANLTGPVTFAPEAGCTITLDAPFAGSGRLVAAGPGTVVLGAAEQHTGGTAVSGGTLAIATAQTDPLGLSLSSGATLALNNGGSVVENPLNMPGGTTLDFNAGNVTQPFPNDVTGPGDVLVTLGGNGFEVVSGSLGHSGTTTVSTGTLVINGTLNNSSAVIVTNTGTLAGGGVVGAPIIVGSTNSPTAARLRMGDNPMNVPGTLTVSNLTLGAGSELDIKLGTDTTVGGGVNDLLVVNGDLTIDPNAFLNILPMAALTPGTYVVATYSGTLTGQFNDTVGGLTRYGLTIDYSTPGQIKLNVTGSGANLVWYGATNGVPVNTWDVLGTPNWLNGTSPDVFYEGDGVTFDDTATNFNVQLTTTLYPASITFNNNSNYSITGTGSGRITGSTGITKNGSGTVLMASGVGVGNDFTGPVQVNDGIFKLNGTHSLGATNGATYVASGATLDLNHRTPNDEPMFIQGAGFGGTNGAIDNSASTSPAMDGGPRSITLVGDTTLNASGGRWDMGLTTPGAGGGYFLGNGHTLTKIGTQDIWLHELGDIGVGDIFVNEGRLGFQYTIGMGNPAGTITVAPGASFGIWQAANVLSKQVVLAGGADLYSDGGAGTSNVLSGSITLSGTNTINASNYPLDLLDAIGGSGGFQKSGSGPLYLESANTYTGPTLLNSGSIVLGAGGSIANSSLITLADGTILDVSLPASGLSLASGQKLSGSGSLLGEITAGTGATLAPGTALAAGTLSVSNDLVLNDGSTITLKLSSDPYTIGNGVNDLILVGSNLVLNGTCTLQVVPLGTLSGDYSYTVMQCNTGPYGYGNLVLGPGAHFAAVSTNPRYTVTVDTNSYPGAVLLSVSGSSAPLLWHGGVAGKESLWDHSTANWLDATTSQPDNFFNGDTVTFDDTAASALVSVVGAETPGSITMSNNAINYRFEGDLLAGPLDLEGTGSLTLATTNMPAFTAITANSGSLVFDVQGPAVYSNNVMITDNGYGQATLVKAGTNTLVFNGNNPYLSAGFLITDGVLQYTNAGSLGTTYAPLTVTNTGTLDMNGVSLSFKSVTISGAGLNGQGALISSKGVQQGKAPIAYLTLADDATLGAPNGIRWDFTQPATVLSQINGNDHKLTKVGTGTVMLYDQQDGDTHLGDIDVVEGRLAFQLSAGGTVLLGDPSKTLTLETNTILTFYDVTNGVMDKKLVFSGDYDPTNGLICFDSGGHAGTTNCFSGPVTLVGTNNLFGLRRDLILSNAISGSGGFIVGRSSVGAGTSTLWLYGNNTYTGPTIINNNYGVVVGSGSSLGTSSLIQLGTGASLDISALSSLSLGAGQALLGAGTNIGNVVLGSGATLLAGFPDANAYTLTISGSLTLQPGSTNIVIVNKGATLANDMVAGLASVTMGGTLLVTNVGTSPLDGGDAIPLFSASSGYIGGFDNIIPATPGRNLAWDTSTLVTDGTLRVVRTGPPTTPTNIVFSVSGNQLTLSWPSEYTGWTLQVQTNAPGVGLTPDWVDVTGSSAVNQEVLQIDPANGSVFYRMVLYP